MRKSASPCRRWSRALTKLLPVIAFIGMVASLPTVSRGETISPGDVVVAYVDPCGCGFTFYTIEVFDSNGRPKFTYPLAETTDILMSPDGTMLVSEPGNDLVTYSATLQQTSRLPTGVDVAALAMNRQQDVFAIGSDGNVVQLTQGGGEIRRFKVGVSPGGTLLGADLGADQCTLYYVETATRAVRRHDICTGTQLSDTGALPAIQTHSGGRLRVSRTGDVIVAGYSAIYRVNPAGDTFRIAVPEDSSSSVVPTVTGEAVWSAGFYLSRFDVRTGSRTQPEVRILGSPFLPNLDIFGIPRAAAPPPVSIPMNHTTFLFALAIGLAMVAIAAHR